MTETTESPVSVQVRYQPPGAAAPIEQLLVSTTARIEGALHLLANGPAETKEPITLPPTAAYFVAQLHALKEHLDALAASLAEQGQDLCNPNMVGLQIPAIPLADLRAIGSGPKQIAALLGCEAGYFDNSSDTICLFSPVRFAPTKDFFDMRQPD